MICTICQQPGSHSTEAACVASARSQMRARIGLPRVQAPRRLQMVDREHLTINQVCDECQVTRDTVYNWMETGKVRYTRTPGGARRILRSSLWRPTDHAGNPSLPVL